MNKARETNSVKYYQKVASHFDEDAQMFEERYEENPVLKKIRGEFRKHTERYDFTTALEIGSGPGIDLVYFAGKYPGRNFYGIDLSTEMVRISNQNIREEGVDNAVAKTGSVEDIPDLFPGVKFGLIYVYFGGLNTVFDLEDTVNRLYKVTTTNAILVLTSVNRYYFMDFVFKSLKLKWTEATARFRDRWKGYSPGRDLPSHVYSSNKVKSTFQPEFRILYKRGYSLFYPPWFGARHLNKIKGLGPLLWKFDSTLQHTPLWNIGEYSLYVMRRQEV